MEKGTGKHEEIVVNKKKSIRQMVFIDIVIKVSNCLLIACSWGIPGKKGIIFLKITRVFHPYKNCTVC